jgi:hypothetical protein
MTCEEYHLTDRGLHDASANDDAERVDPWSAADLLGTSAWLDYVQKWNPLRYVPRPWPKRKAS